MPACTVIDSSCQRTCDIRQDDSFKQFLGTIHFFSKKNQHLRKLVQPVLSKRRHVPPHDFTCKRTSINQARLIWPKKTRFCSNFVFKQLFISSMT